MEGATLVVGVESTPAETGNDVCSSIFALTDDVMLGVDGSGD